MSSELAYYTQMAQAHASIIVATIFGLFSVLRITSDRKRSLNSKYILTGLYIVLLIFGEYEVARYRFYSDKAKNMAFTDFQETDWWKEWEFLKPFSDCLWNYSGLIFAAFGVAALIGADEKLRKFVFRLK
jgi:hypothetical protein